MQALFRAVSSSCKAQLSCTARHPATSLRPIRSSAVARPATTTTWLRGVSTKRYSRQALKMADQEDEDLKLAIALSLQEAQDHEDVLDRGNRTHKAQSGIPASILHEKANKTTSSAELTSSLLGLDRAKMEQERLERKRKANGLPAGSSSAPEVKKSKIDIPSAPAKVTCPPPSSSNVLDVKTSCINALAVLEKAEPKAQKARIGNHPANTSAVPSTTKARGDALPAPTSFPAGAVRKTWAKGFPRADDLTIEEVLQKDDLQLAVLSSFQWDIAWLLQKVDFKRSKVILVMEAQDEATRAQYRTETADVRNLRLCFPPMPGVAARMHSKLMLLSHPTYLRIAVPSANLVPYDWGETGHMENSLFVIDLPRLPAGQRAPDVADLPPFGQELVHFCTAIGLPAEIVRSLTNFDFAKTRDYALVHSIGGPHEGTAQSWKRTGYPGLGRAVAQLGLAAGGTNAVRIDFVSSSLGSLNSDFLAGLYLAAQGDDGTAELAARAPAAAKQLRGVRKLPATKDTLADCFTIYFPSGETVDRSRGGPEGAGTVCFQGNWFHAPRFPQRRLRDCQSTRQGLLMHNKIMYVRPDEETARRNGATDAAAPSTGGAPRAWAYVGSANLSESAWGKLIFDRATKQVKLNCRNWECGVIVPVPLAEGLKEGLGVFEGTVPVPMQVPAPPLSEDRRPWFFMER